MESAPTISAAELAELLGGTVVGDAARTVRSVATLDEAGPDALSWLGNAAYLPKLATTRAGVVLVRQDCDLPAGLTAVRVPDPDVALCEVLARLAPPADRVPPGVDPTARIADTATIAGVDVGPHVLVGPRSVIGPGTQLHAGVWIGSDCRIGRDCILWPHVVMRERCTLGDRVIVHPQTTIGADGFGYLQRGGRHHKIPQVGRVVVEDDVEIGAGCCIDRARSGVTRVGRGTKIDNLVQIGHNAQVGEHCILIAQCGVSGSVTLGQYVTLAGQVGIADHIHLGNRVTVAAQAGVMNDQPDGATIIGTPAVDRREFVQRISLRRTAKIMAELQALATRVQKLESATDH